MLQVGWCGRECKYVTLENDFLFPVFGWFRSWWHTLEIIFAYEAWVVDNNVSVLIGVTDMEKESLYFYRKITSANKCGADNFSILV